MTERMTVEFEDVAKRFDERVIFRAVSGRAEPGSVLVLAGPNGSGKSTLVSILCGLLRPTRGRIRFVALQGELERTSWRHHLGVVAPAMALYEELTARENLSFFARVRGHDVSGDEIDGCITAVGLDPGRTTPVRGYSTGMQQRLKIAQSMLHRPAVLFLDEPGSNLDPAGQDWLEGWVGRLAAEGRTIVLATNDRREMSWGSGRVDLAG
jgi:heme exporter protein A